jgi:hypothetical protein
MRKHPNLAPLVSEAADQLARLIPDGELRLELLPDPEYGEGEQLFLGIFTALPDAQALEALQRFDREWWVHNAGHAGGLLCIDLCDE